MRQRASDGLWVGTHSSGFKPNGKRDRRYVYAPTKAECMAKLRKLQGQSPTADAGTQTLSDYLVRWLDADALHSAPRTHENRKILVRLHIAPHLGRAKLSALTPSRITAWHVALAASGVGPGAARSASLCLSAALAAAVTEGLIVSNPCLSAKKPKERHREMVTMTAEQTRALLSVGDTLPVGPFLHLALGTGCRVSELLALQWADCDLDTEPVAITIRRSLTWTRAGGFATKPPKSAASNRPIALPSHAANALRKLAASPLKDSTLVFATRTGSYLARANARRAVLNAASKVPGLPKGLRLHDLRHTHASLLLSGGASVKAVARRLGHANAAVTLRVYAHCLPGDDSALAGRFAAILASDPLGGTQAAVGENDGSNQNEKTP